jgi:hypothetical protein
MFLLNLIFIWCELGVIERECYYWNLPPVVAHQKLLIIRLPLSDALLLAALVFQDIFSVVCVCACVAVCVENEKQKKTQPKCMGYDTAPHSLDITCKITFSMSDRWVTCSDWLQCWDSRKINRMICSVHQQCIKQRAQK